MLKLALSGQLVGHQKLNVLFRRCLQVRHGTSFLDSQQNSGGSKISGATPKPRLSFPHLRQDLNQESTYQLRSVWTSPSSFSSISRASAGGPGWQTCCGVGWGECGRWGSRTLSAWRTASLPLRLQESTTRLGEAAEVLNICSKTSETHHSRESHDLNSTVAARRWEETQIMKDSDSLADTPQADTNARNQSTYHHAFIRVYSLY